MTRTLWIAALIAAGMFFTGCQNPRVTDAHLLTTEAAMQKAQGEGFLVPDATETDFVENAAAACQGYRDALTSLANYYASVGNATKLRWANTELKTFDQMVHYRYLQPAEWAPQNLSASDSIADADILYRQARKLDGDARLIVVVNEGKLRQALGLYNDLIGQYPTSDKIDDAAYHAAQIYEYLKNYELAALYYQRTFQWNEATPYPTRFNAARVMDQKLRMRAEALALYRLAVEKEARYAENTEYANLRIQVLSTPRVDEEVVPEDNNVIPVEAQPTQQ